MANAADGPSRGMRARWAMGIETRLSTLVVRYTTKCILMFLVKSVNIRTELHLPIRVYPGGLLNEVNVDGLPQVHIAMLAALDGSLNTH